MKHTTSEAALVEVETSLSAPRAVISFSKLVELFPDELTAREYLKGRLWPSGKVCPQCKSGERITTRKNGFYRCNSCKLDFTVRTGTIFERSHIPLKKWLYVMHALVTVSKEISSVQLAKEIGVTQKSAWFMLRRLREACSSDDNLNELRSIAKTLSGNPPELDLITDIVLAYRPKPKTRAAKRRKRRQQRKEQKDSTIPLALLRKSGFHPPNG